MILCDRIKILKLQKDFRKDCRVMHSQLNLFEKQLELFDNKQLRAATFDCRHLITALEKTIEELELRKKELVRQAKPVKLKKNKFDLI